MATRPYKSTPVFTQDSLPDGLRRNHSLKPGCWGRLHVLTGVLCYTDADTGAETVLCAGESKVIAPEHPHFVEPVGTMSMRVDFFDQAPA